MNNKAILGAFLLGTGILAGCSTSTVGTHQAGGVPTPSISTTNSIANVEVGEQVRGSGCANEFLRLFKSGDTKFLETYGNSGSSTVDRAKAAAAYKALSTGSAVNDDMLIYPVWEVEQDRTFFGLISNNVCAEVVGYRATVEGFEQSDTLTEPNAESGSAGSFFGFF